MLEANLLLTDFLSPTSCRRNRRGRLALNQQILKDKVALHSRSQSGTRTSWFS